MKLTKSKLMDGLVCPKKLFLTLHSYHLARPHNADEKMRFDWGNRVGELARKAFPGGILVKGDHRDYASYLDQTKDAIGSNSQAIFEASFFWEDYFARVDVLKRDGETWDAFEVKSSTTLKDEHVVDIAIQAWIIQKSGFEIRDCYVMYVNRDSVGPQSDDYFKTECITEKVKALLEKGLGDTLLELRSLANSPTSPATDIGPQCGNRSEGFPYECRFLAQCWQKIPQPSVFDISGLGAKAWDFYKRGEIALDSIDKAKLPPRGKKILECYQSGVLNIDHAGIASALSNWVWPVAHLDFETAATPLPWINGVRPYQAVAFQASVHLQSKDGDLEHFEYLHDSKDDPRHNLAAFIVKSLGNGHVGSILSYSMSVERKILLNLADVVPDLRNEILAIADRLVDLAPIFKDFVDHPDLLGYYSIKRVGPALLGHQVSYETLDLNSGGSAGYVYEQMIHSNDKQLKQKLREDLLKYCELDTKGMVLLTNWLLEKIR